MRKAWKAALVCGAVASLCSLSLAQATSTSAGITGCVVDRDGAEVSGARVLVTRADGSAERSLLTDGDGCYRVDNLAPGDLKLAFSANGFAPRTTSATLHPGETLQLPPIELSVASQNDNVQVSASRQDLAEAEIKVEETQRLAGFYPNFFVTYDWHAAPLDTRQKFKLSAHEAFDPATIGVDAATAGIEQAANAFSGYGPGPQGYAKRFGAAVADSTIGIYLAGAVLPMVFHQDPRYFYMGIGTMRHRALYAIATAVICRGDNGKWQPNYSSVLGDFGAGAISNLYYPASNRNGASLTIENGLIGTATDALNNLLEEFVFRKLTPHAPHYNPTPAP